MFLFTMKNLLFDSYTQHDTGQQPKTWAEFSTEMAVVDDVLLHCKEAKLYSLKLKAQPRQLLASLPVYYMLTGIKCHN
jgi:hypothetical protein